MHKNLLDTHTFIWFINGDKQLSSVARVAIEKEDAINFISIASIWEMAIKISLRKLELKPPFTEINKQILENNFILLPIQIEDSLVVANLPFHHRDPFDRIIIAQAIQNDLSIISKDGHFDSYEVKIVW
jgi:PIN domain nuclease of toxin-antitoxin system